MSLDACLPDLVASGEITQARADQVAKDFQQLNMRLARKMNATSAAELAGQQVLAGMEKKLTLDQLRTVLRVKAQKQGLLDMQAYGDKTGREGFAAIRGMLADDDQAPYFSAHRRGETIQGSRMRLLYDVIQKHRRNHLGQVRNKAEMDHVIDVIHGAAPKSAEAKAAVEAWQAVFEESRLGINREGGAIGKLEGGYFPQKYDSKRVRDAAKDTPEYRRVRKERDAAYKAKDIAKAEKLDAELIDLNYRVYRDFMLPHMAVEKMRNPKTDAAFDADSLEAFMRGSFEAKRTDGMAGQGQSDGGGSGASLIDHYSQHRSFVFKDGPAWRAVAARFGDPDSFNVGIAQINSMARDQALLQRFGPNPEMTFRYLMDRAERRLVQSGADGEKALFMGKGQRVRAQELWDVVTGKLDQPVEGAILKYVGRPLQGARNIITSAYLGSSNITALSDFNTTRMARGMAGLPFWSSAVTGMLRQLNPLSDADRRLAVELGAGARNATQSMLGLNRYFGEQNQVGWSSIVADETLRLSGNNALTEGGQRDFHNTFLWTLGREKDVGFDKLPEPTRETFVRYGLDADDWDVMRAAEPRVESGVFGSRTFVDPYAITNMSVRDRLLDMVGAETDKAIQMSTPQMRALMSFGQKGTVPGEVGANMLQLKTFTASILQTHINRMIALGPKRGAAYAANFLIGMTLMGALVIQLKEIANRRDPRPMDNLEFWGDALLSGGGLGIVGDFIGSVFSDRDASQSGFFLGPVVGAGIDVVDQTFGKATDDNEENDWDGLPILAKRYTPIASSLWYGKQAFNEVVVEQLGQWAHHDWDGYNERLIDRAEDNGNPYFSEPGQGLIPQRAPDFANAINGSVPESE
jgi:hypothetical protein